MAIERISRPGEYQGYSQSAYDDYERTSRYVVMRDGVKIAVDRYWPVANGTPAAGPLPTIFITHRYMRAYERPDGTVGVALDDFFAYPWFVRNGYAVVIWDPRGGGASFGEYHGLLSVEETQDAVEMIAWIAEQSWSDGNVGMIG
ncbi:MAG: CocE/NonD family hydrolase, partial [Caulobacterales bacterium]|nr:CocE/NonD family hydrolase [Caulobacterales bacterium]